MKIKLYQTDSFTTNLFSGNPAAVCPLASWIDDDLMKNIAAENNLSETAFYVKEGDYYHLRWFTPTVEVDLCGHATLAAAYVLFDVLKEEKDKIIFDSLSGKLEVTKDCNLITLNFPARRPKKVDIVDQYKKCLDIEPVEAHFHTKLLFVLNSEEEVTNAIPNFEEIAKLNSDGLIITSIGNKTDFVSRYFAPNAGINEDPVTGSAHTVLTPFWSERLSKKKLTARQVSKRGGDLFCEDLNDRIAISGNAVLYSTGEISL